MPQDGVVHPVLIVNLEFRGRLREGTQDKIPSNRLLAHAVELAQKLGAAYLVQPHFLRTPGRARVEGFNLLQHVCAVHQCTTPCTSIVISSCVRSTSALSMPRMYSRASKSE